MESRGSRSVTRALDDLAAELSALGSVVVAFSGGVDSGLLAHVALDVLGPDAMRAVTATSPSLAGAEEVDCRRQAEEWSMPWLAVDTDEMANAAYRRNDVDRCFWCKDALMDAVAPLAGDATVVLGVNVDDLADHRPGQDAARARGARFPLVDAGFTKALVREAARARGLRTWDKPAAPCLASRLPYGTPVTLGRLRSVEAAEAALHDLGYPVCRVRHHGAAARVEVPVDRVAEAQDDHARIREALVAVGYRWVSVESAGLRSGGLNPPVAGVSAG